MLWPRPWGAAPRDHHFRHTCIFEEIIYGKRFVFCFKNVTFPFHDTISLLSNLFLLIQARSEQFKICFLLDDMVTLEYSLFLCSRRVKRLYLKLDSGPHHKLNRLPVLGYNFKNSSSYNNWVFVCLFLKPKPLTMVFPSSSGGMVSMSTS